MKNVIKLEDIKKAIDFALKEYDIDTIIDICTHEVGGWTLDAKLLNDITITELIRVADKFYR